MTENIPKDEVAIPLGPASEEIVKIIALLGVSGFLFEIALTIPPPSLERSLRQVL